MENINHTGTPRRHLEYPHLTMYQMIAKIASQYPDYTAYDFYGRKTTYEQFHRRINRAAMALVSLGVKPGDAVTVCLPNIPQAVDLFYAIDRIGAIANMIHPQSAKEEIIYYLNEPKSRWIITPDMFYEKVRAAADAADEKVTVICLRIQDELPAHLKAAYILKAGRPYLKYPQNGDILWSRYLKEAPEVQLPHVEFEEKRTSVILYSGGTTGLPKGVCLSDLNFNALALQAKEFIQVELEPGLTMLSCMPMFHGFGLGINIHTILVHGACCILMPSFNIKTYADMIRKKKPNFIAGVPTIFDALLHADGLKNVDLSFMQGMFCGGDSLQVELKKRIDTFLKEHNASIQVREGYGLTECVTASCLTPKDEYRESSIGLPFPDTEYAIVKPGTDEPCAPNEEGEIVLKGPTLMIGYLNHPEETALTLRRRSDGDIWLYTGDLGHMDEDGFVYFRQRIKRMIVTNGYNVYPDPLENSILRCAGVDRCCVIGVKDSRRGQRVKAFIVLKDPAEKSEEKKKAILTQLKEMVAGYAIPKEIEFRDELPLTLVGKVAFHKLEEEEEAKCA